MNKQAIQDYYDMLHAQLGRKYRLSPVTVQNIRQMSITRNMSRQEMVKELINKINSCQEVAHREVNKKLRYEEAIHFLTNCPFEDFLEVTKKC